MLKSVKFPEGRVIKEFKGGPKSLKQVITLLKKRGFHGYLKVVAEGDPNIGYVILGGGRRVVVLFFGPRGTLIGKDAVPRFRDLARSRDCMISVHTDVEIEPLLATLQVDRREPIIELKLLGKKLEEWKRGRGKSLDVDIGQSLSKVISVFAEQEEDETEPDGEAAPNVAHEGRVKTAVRRARKPRAKAEKPKKAEERGSGRAVKKRKKAPAASGKGARKGGRKAPDPETGLLATYTFENFLVGSSNQFAYSACTAVMEATEDSYNPLFLVGKPGLGKTHLLHALGNGILKRQSGVRLRYLTAGQFKWELEEAEREDQLAQFRRGFRELDVIVLDDVQDSDGRMRVEEELFNIFEDFDARGKRLILAADRRPSETQQLNSRLVSRFESGLVVELQAPDMDIRLAHLRKILKARKASCPEDALRHIAEAFDSDFRELEGALNKVLAHAAAHNKAVGLRGTLDALGLAKSSPSEQGAEAPGLDLLPAHSYLIEGEKLDLAYRLFSDRARSVRGMLITRTNPSRIKQSFEMGGAEILWLTHRSESSERTVEPVLEMLVHIVESFIIDRDRGIIMLDGLDYLRSSHGFEPVLKFIRHVVDDVSESEFIFLLAIDPATLEQRELKILEREMEVFSS